MLRSASPWYLFWQASLVAGLLTLAIGVQADAPLNVRSTPEEATIKPPRVVATIKPLQLIAQAITAGVSDVEVLLPPGASPHDYSLKPSERSRLDAAALVLWVGPDMEVFLDRILGRIQDQRVLAMMPLAGIRHLTQEPEHGHKHAHGDQDPHIWLSTDNALVMARAIYDRLVQLDGTPANQTRYRENLGRFERQLRQANEDNRKKLSSVRQQPFFVFHDAYRHLQASYDLNIAGAFTLNPQQQPGAQHLNTLREKLRQTGARCVFREPQFQPGYLNQLAETLQIKVAELDPLASKITVDEQGYVNFINGLINNIYNCLSSPVASASAG